VADAKQTAGRLIFAAGDRDEPAAREAVRAFHPSGNWTLILTLAETAALALEALHGDGWRDALSLALLDAELDGEVVDDADE